MSTVSEKLGFPYSQIIPGRPQGNGQAEIMVKLLKRNLKHHMAENGNVYKYLSEEISVS